MSVNVVDLDDPSTWPPGVRARASDLAAQLRGTTQSAVDLGVLIEQEDEFRKLLSGHRVRAFHATKLLDHEVLAIRDDGLAILSREQIAERLEAAYRHSEITADERAQLAEANVFMDGTEEHRAGKVCLVLGRRILNDGGDIYSLLSTWGGESIYNSRRGAALEDRLRQMGRPTLVVAALDLSAGRQRLYITPPLQKVFVGQLLGLRDAEAEVHYPSPVRPEHVVAIWQPGNREYDRFTRLPRR